MENLEVIEFLYDFHLLLYLLHPKIHDDVNQYYLVKFTIFILPQYFTLIELNNKNKP